MNGSGGDVVERQVMDMQRSVRRLQWVVGILVLAWLATIGWLVSGGASVGPVLSVERLEIVEPDGKPAMVLANSERPIAATLDGKTIMEGQEEERKGMPSIIFFDGKGDEVGGMLMGVTESEDGFQATRHISLDGYKQDQTVVLAHYQNPEGSQSGLIVSDRPSFSMAEAYERLGIEIGATREEVRAAIMGLPAEVRQQQLRELFGLQRAFLGSTYEEAAMLVMRDGEGRRRVVIEVPKDGEASITILDEAGEPVVRLPEALR